MRKVCIVLLAGLLAFPSVALAEKSVEEQVKDLQEEIEYLWESVDRTERHAATDRITFTGDLRVKADSLHYKDGYLGMNGAFGKSPFIGDHDNDIVYTSRLRLNMKAKVYKNVSFAGRLSMYKNWGDSTGVKVFDSWSSFTMDGTNGGNTTGDWLRVERAYFNWKDIGDTKFYLSIGRRPSTYGPPTQYRENEMRGGTPSGHLVNFNFDGVTIGYKLGEHTGVEGQTVRFCYGQGYESEFGNGGRFNEIDLEDTHLGGFNVDALNDGTNFLQFTLFGAKDVTDGFKGLAVMPVLDTDNDGIPDSPNNNGFISRLQARNNIGDMLLGGVGFSREEMNGVNYFLSLGWTQARPSGDVGMFGGMLTDTPGDEENKDGYSVYAGLQVPAPLGKFGVEYNFGSKYWAPFTQAQDDLLGSKLATRGHVGEAYYIFEVNPRMFIKLDGLYYDYEYSGSGTPVGQPQNVDEMLNGEVGPMASANGLPVYDKAWDANASLTIKF